MEGKRPSTYTYSLLQHRRSDGAVVPLGVYAKCGDEHAMNLYTQKNEDIHKETLAAIEEMEMFMNNGLLLEADMFSETGLHFSEEDGVMMCVNDVFDFDSSILSALSSGDKKEALYRVLKEDLEDWISVDTSHRTIEEAEKNFISTVEEF